MLEKYKEKKGYNQTAISGIIININGDVWIKKKNKSEQKVFIGNLIEIEDLIQTSDDSFVDIMFEDRFQIRVLSNSSLQINLQNQVWHIKQNFGRAVYMVKKGIDVPLLVEASSFLVRVVGTFFYVENEKDLLVEVVEGTVEILKHDPNTKEIQYLDKLDKHEQILFESKREEFQKKVSKNSELVVIFSEMSKQAEIYNNDEIWESLSKIPNIKDKKEIETLYNRTLEKIKLIDDRIVEGIIVSQHGDIVILHTTDGVKVIELDKIKEIIYEHTQ
ncbi:MAG: FecR domain-containing protein [Leptospiraceae bacterium]|nr:FecR domain-containing protein [Leptospiraceae bacterium]MDW7975804.1 FecR family protein [Leptospiraceae bacterium]